MGYTHYWARTKTPLDVSAWAMVLEDCCRITDEAQCPLDVAFGPSGLRFNGSAAEAAEAFVLPAAGPRAFSFCKTRGLPYDVVVVACLAAMKDRLGASIRVNSDGRMRNLDDGVELAQKILGRPIANPLDVEDE